VATVMTNDAVLDSDGEPWSAARTTSRYVGWSRLAVPDTVTNPRVRSMLKTDPTLPETSQLCACQTTKNFKKKREPWTLFTIIVLKLFPLMNNSDSFK
jgi:hypothetical protein